MYAYQKNVTVQEAYYLEGEKTYNKIGETKKPSGEQVRNDTEKKSHKTESKRGVNDFKNV